MPDGGLVRTSTVDPTECQPKTKLTVQRESDPGSPPNRSGTTLLSGRSSSQVPQFSQEDVSGSIRFQEMAMAVTWSVVWRQPRLDQGEWLGNGYMIQAVNEKLGQCRREGR